MALPDFVRKLLLLGHFRWQDGALFVGGERSVVFRAGLLAELQQELERSVGHEETTRLMKELGAKQATSAFERYVKDGMAKSALPDKDEKTISEDPIIKAGRLFLETTGWGKFSYLWFKGQKKSVVVVENSPIAAAFLERYKKSDGPVCHFIAGLLEGSTGFLSGMSVRYAEKTCAAQGGRVCTFEGRFS